MFFHCSLTGKQFLLETIQRTTSQKFGIEGWKTFYRTEYPTQHAVKFNENSTTYTIFYRQVSVSETSRITDHNLCWGVTTTADDEIIRVLFIINSPYIERNLEIHFHKIFLSKLFYNKNLYFKRSAMTNDGQTYSQYYIFHSLNSSIVNPNHFSFMIGNISISTVRIKNVHKIIRLNRLIYQKNKKTDWIFIPGQTKVSALFMDKP